MVYKYLIPGIALFNLLFLLAFLAINRNYLRDFFFEIGRKTWLWLIFFLAIALGLRLTVFHLHHMMFIDEFLYMEAAKNILQNFHQGNYFKSIGWPFVLALFFGFFRVSNWMAIYTTVVLGSLTVASFFCLTYLITKNKIASLFSAASLALLPLHIRWSASAETNVPSLFFITLALFFTFFYYQNKKYSLFWLAFFSLIFAALFRPENLLLILLFFNGFFLFKIKINSHQIMFVIFALLILFLPLAMQQVNCYSDPSDNRWNLNNLKRNSLDFGPEIFTFRRLPFFISFLAVFGLLYLLVKRPREALFLVSSFIFFWVVYFSAWFQNVGGRERFYLNFYLFILIFAGFGFYLFFCLFPKIIFRAQVSSLFKFICFFLFLVFSFLPSYGYILTEKRLYSWAHHRLATNLPALAEKYLPQNAIIIANWPTLLQATTDLEVVNLSLFLSDSKLQNRLLKNEKPVLFLEGFFCFSLLCPKSFRRCKVIKDDFEMIPHKKFSKKEAIYTFYEITGFRRE